MSLPSPPGWNRSRRTAYAFVALFAFVGTGMLTIGLLARDTQFSPAWFIAALGFYAGAFLSLPREAAPVARDGALVFPASGARIAASLMAVPTIAFMMPWGLVVAAGILVAMIVGQHRHVREVVLDPRGVTVRSHGDVRRVPWAEVSETVTMPEPHNLRVGDGRPWGTSHLATDPADLYWTLRHYALHPEDRAEFADGRAVERVRRANLVAAFGTAPALVP